jgi:mgtE-like transporter
MARRLPRLRRPRLTGLLGPDGAVARQSLVALALNSSTSLVAGAVLASLTGTFERLPGLLVLVPAAIGLRGNVFSALGSRLSTAIHTGTFRLSWRLDTVLGQNLIASMLLTVSMSLVLATAAKAISLAFGLESESIATLALISIVGGLLASAIVLVATVALAAGSVRYGWDLDNLVAPVVSTLGDVLTLPALWLASHLVDVPGATAVGDVVAAIAIVSFVVGIANRRELLRRVVRESAPILTAAVVLSTLAGVTLEKRLDTFATYPALLLLVPAFVSSAGALGGILSSRLATKLHLGMLTPAPVPDRGALNDAAMVLALAVPVYLFNAIGAHYVGLALGEASPGLGAMVAATLTGAAAAVLFVVAVAYYGTIAAVRLGVDPDTYGTPVVTSSVDFVGAVALIVAILSLGIV